MMNVLAIGLLVSSFAAAGVWSPPLEKQQHRDKENVILKEGRRVIVVEYEKEGFQPSSSSDSENPLSMDGVREEKKVKYGESASNSPNLGQFISSSTQKEQTKSAKEMVCDAYGICKEKISGMFGATKVKDKMAEKMTQINEGAKEAAEKVVHGGETLVEKAEGLADGVVEKVKRTGQDLAGKVKRTGEGLGKTSWEKTQVTEDLAQKPVEEKKSTDEELAEKAKKSGKNILEKGNRTVEEEAGKGKETGRDVVKKSGVGRRNLTEIIRRGQEVAYDAGMYAIAPESLKSLMAVLHLLGFSSTYGICVWLTFASSYVLARALPRQQLGLVQSKIYPVYFRAITYGIALSFLSHLFIHGWRSSANSADMFEAHNLLGCLGLVLVNTLYLEPRATKVAFECLKLEKEEGRGRDIADMGEPRTPATTATITRRTAATTFGSGSSPVGAAIGNSPVITSTSTTTTTATAAGRRAEPEAKSRLVELSRRLKNLNSYSSSLNMAVLMGLTWHLVYLSQRLHVSC